ncbi:MAG: alpha/beta hydrolase [Anaerolineae bacterium]|nr:alpha/beta hydrolase [Anaerolineae bacterium]
MSVSVLDGIRAKMITTPRLTTRVLFSGDESGSPVLFLHGNSSCATWWEPVMLALPDGFFGVAPDQRGYGDADRDALIDATRGMGDFADDVVALLNTLGYEKVHLVAISLGGSIAWQLLMDAPERFATITLVNPGSPYGFGGSKGADGEMCYADGAGGGAGLVNGMFVQLLQARDTSTDSPFSPRNVLRGLFVPNTPNPYEDQWLDALLSIHLGEKAYPGDFVPSANYPYTAPGVWGANNAISRKYVPDYAPVFQKSPKHTILWIRGGADTVVADMSMRDIGTLAKLGYLTRTFLEKYKAHGGDYEEMVIEGAGHVPYLEKPDEFNALLHAKLKG